MNLPVPHYLLSAHVSRTIGFGHWRFSLRPVDGSAATLEAADMEPNTWGERLDLLTVLRGLESLDQPSRVTLVGCSRYVEQGILYGLTEWRDNDWRWEYFGQMAPVRDADLWQRMDRVLQIHQVDCQRRRFDQGHDPVVAPHWNIAKGCKNWVDRIVEGEWVKCYAPQAAARCMVWKDTALRLWHKMLEFKGLGFRVQGSGFRT